MIQSIYNQVGKVGLTPCSKDRPQKPIPLLKSNFLGEFQTELEKKLARENIDAVTDKYTYPNSEPVITNIEEVSTIYGALDYALTLVKSYQDKDIENIVSQTKTDLENLTNIINDPETGIASVNSKIIEINTSITTINDALANLNVDDKIEAWVLNHSGSVSLDEDGKLGFAISSKEGNAIQREEDGLYVENSAAAVYHPDLNDSLAMEQSVGGISQGTTVDDLKDKSFSSILDKLLFPVTTRDLVNPYIISSVQSQLVEINSVVIPASSTFYQGDAGALISKVDTILFNGFEYTETTYNNLGDYTYSTVASYNAGEYLIDNRGNTTDKRVEAGTISQTLAIIKATYPWYYNNQKGELVEYYTQSDLLEFNLSGKAVIKIPGSDSTLDSFKVNGGLGYLDVDLSGWTKTTEEINNYTYQVWTKNDSYSSELPHQIQFTLA